MSIAAHAAGLNHPRSIELSIGGMTCASCAAGIEKKLNKLHGVSASVNYATETAKITYADSVAAADLIATVEATGYTAAAPSTAPPDDEIEPGEAAAVRTRLLVSLVLTVPVVALSMIPMWLFANWQWLALTLASPVVRLGSSAVSPCRLGQRASRRRHHGTR